MKKIILIIFLIIIFNSSDIYAWKDPIGDVNNRIDNLEKVQIQDQEYFTKIQQELQRVQAVIIARQGAINELKDLLQIGNILQDAEFIPNEEKEKENEKKDENTAIGIVNPAGNSAP